MDSESDVPTLATERRKRVSLLDYVSGIKSRLTAVESDVKAKNDGRNLDKRRTTDGFLEDDKDSALLAIASSLHVKLVDYAMEEEEYGKLQGELHQRLRDLEARNKELASYKVRRCCGQSAAHAPPVAAVEAVASLQ